MPLIAHSDLPSFQRLKDQGETILSRDRADSQVIRELHIGLLNMMPDAALEATERQFFRLIGHSNEIAQFYVHPFSLSSIERGEKASAHIGKHYKTLDEIKTKGLDALIITGANVSHPDLERAPFYEQLKEVIEWSYENVTSTLCSCLATHAVLGFRYNQKRRQIGDKCWGVFPHQVVDRHHPLVNGVNTRFDIPHSRFNEVAESQFEKADVQVLAKSTAGVHLAVSPDLFRLVFFQGHPEYDTVSLLKEYKREVLLYLQGKRLDYPPMPENYLSEQNQAILNEYRVKLASGEMDIKDFPESLVAETLDNTWHDSATAVINNWIGCVYQVTHEDVNKPFMDGINPQDPLNLKG
ncbi:MAG: homoserine O-succinyltransferase [Gammaproteobacteria bacterium]|nr:homoserine O-succinyltransferase [Gammaproteobacteria bacterium]